MFAGCRLTSIDFSHFDTSKVTDMKHMFESCTNLTRLNLSSFNTSAVTDMTVMFRYCSNLVTIIVGDDWTTDAVTSSTSMFLNCTSLVGGQGTRYYNSYPTDKKYARIDGGRSDPGYFTARFAGIATDIETVPNKATSVKGIYTLDGRKLNELPAKKGVYIQNGRAILNN